MYTSPFGEESAPISAFSTSQTGAADTEQTSQYSSQTNYAGAVSQFGQAPVLGGPQPSPLRVVHVGAALFRAGIEVWLQGLIRNVSPQRLQFVRCVATTNHYDPRVATTLGAPVELGAGASGVQRAARRCDVMLISGPPEVGQWLAGMERLPLCVAVAHGQEQATRDVLEGCSAILDHAVAVSRGVARTACRGFPTTTINNGVDTVHLARTRSRDQMRASLGYREDDFVIGSVSRLSPEKRPWALLRAVASLPPRFKLLLVGWGPLYNELNHLASQIAPGRVAIVQADENLGDHYQAMDAFALASMSEGYGLAMMEAMMCEVPIMVTPVGFVPDLIVDRINGVIVDGDPESVADAARRMAAHPRWAAALAEEGARTAEKHGHARSMAMSYQTLLERLHRQKCE